MNIILETVLKPLENGRRYIELDKDLIRNEEISKVQGIWILHSEIYYNIDNKLTAFTNFAFIHEDGSLSDTYLHRSEAVNQLDYLIRKGQTSHLYYKHSALPLFPFIKLHSDNFFMLNKKNLISDEAKERRIWTSIQFECHDILCADINTVEPIYLYFLSIHENESNTYDETIILTMRQLNEIIFNLREGTANIHISPYSAEESNILNYYKDVFIHPHEACLSKRYMSYYYKNDGSTTIERPLVYIARQKDLIRCLPTIFYINNALSKV